MQSLQVQPQEPPLSVEAELIQALTWATENESLVWSAVHSQNNEVRRFIGPNKRMASTICQGRILYLMHCDGSDEEQSHLTVLCTKPVVRGQPKNDDASAVELLRVSGAPALRLAAAAGLVNLKLKQITELVDKLLQPAPPLPH